MWVHHRSTSLCLPFRIIHCLPETSARDVSCGTSCGAGRLLRCIVVWPPGGLRGGPSWGLPLFHLVHDPQHADVHKESAVSYLHVSPVPQGQASSTVKFTESPFWNCQREQGVNPDPSPRPQPGLFPHSHPGSQVLVEVSQRRLMCI